MSTHVVIVNWNGGEETLRCLASVDASTSPPAAIHVVDNGSEDGSREAIRAAFPKVRLELMGRNVGFAAGANAGIRRALAEDAAFVFLLNNDARVAPAALAALEAAARRHPDAGLYGGRIFLDRERGILWSCGVSLGFWPNLCRLRGHGRRDGPRFARERVVDSLTGCGLLVSRSVFETVGLLDESYFVYVEDADLCTRARRAGFRCLYVPGAVLEHRGSGSTGGGYSAARKYLSAHGAMRYLKRHGTPALWAGYLIVDVALYPVLLATALLRGRGRGALAKGRGMLHGFLGRPADLSVVEQRRRPRAPLAPEARR